MADIATKLEKRARLVGRVMNGVPDHLLWRWNNVRKFEELRVADLRDGGSNIDYRRPDDKKALMSFTNIRPLEELRDRKVQDIPVGQEKVIDHVNIESFNYDGVIEIPVSYDARLSKLTTREHAFAVGFTESVQQTFGIEAQAGGGEASGGSYVKITASTTLGLESRQDTTDTTTEQEGEDRGAGLSPTCPPGYDLEFILDRKATSMKTRVTGFGDVDHGIKLGKHWDGTWNGNIGKNGKKWPRWGKWDSWDEFLSVIKGEGRRDLFFAEWFWDHPIKGALLNDILEPLDMPFDHTGDVFPGATKLSISQRVLRGPKP